MAHCIHPYITRKGTALSAVPEYTWASSYHLSQTLATSDLGGKDGEGRKGDTESLVWPGVIISVVMGPCTYFMLALRVSSHSH